MTTTTNTILDTTELSEIEAAVLDVLNAEPGTLRFMNPEAITEEHILGPEAVIEDEEEDLPPQERYDEFVEALISLVGKGIVEEQEVLGMKAYYLSNDAYQAYHQAGDAAG